jgi:hypothetical protein
MLSRKKRIPESFRFFVGSSSLAMNKRTPIATMSSAIGTITFAMLNSTHNSRIVNDLARSDMSPEFTRNRIFRET